LPEFGPTLTTTNLVSLRMFLQLNYFSRLFRFGGIEFSVQPETSDIFIFLVFIRRPIISQLIGLGPSCE